MSFLDRFRQLASNPNAVDESFIQRIRAAGATELDERECIAAPLWDAFGRPRYVLSDSIAALLSTTRAPALLRLPFEVFLIEVPRPYLPCQGPAHWPAWIMAARIGDEGLTLVEVASCGDVSTDVDAVVLRATNDHPLNELHEDRLVGEIHEGRLVAPSHALKVGLRLLGNVCAYVTQYQAACVPRGGRRRSTGENVVAVRPPADVVIARVFRRQAAALVASRSFRGARQALQHMVRGHWKYNGTKWIYPYLRGREAFGRVLERVTRLGEV